MKLRDALQEIYEQHSKLTPALVVDSARAEGHPLHAHFEWDDSIAGEKYREVQARELIRSVKIKYVIDDREEETRYFVSVQRSDGIAYEPTEKVLEDEVATQVVLRSMEREWKALRSRYAHFKEFWQLVKTESEFKAA